MNHIKYVNIHINVCLSEWMLYTHLCYHSPIFDTHGFQLYMCTFIYLTVILSSCPTATILTVCWAPLPNAIVKTSRL